MESNLNLDLIEKVKSGKAAIEHTRKSKDQQLLNDVLSAAFPNLTKYALGTDKYYFKKANDYGYDSLYFHCPERMEAIRLSAFFTNELPKEDKQLISKIDELLGQLNNISQSVFELREHASLVLPDVAPIDTKEEAEYVECVDSYLEAYQKGVIYPVNKNDMVIGDIGYAHFSIHSPIYHLRFKPSTREAYLSQQGEQPNQIKEEVKERWCPTIINESYWIISQKFFAQPVRYFANEYDKDFISVGNYFKTEQEAQAAATHIKQYLTSLQF